MASVIKPDVAGVVLAHKGTEPVWLRAGDSVPAGVKVDASLVVAPVAKKSATRKAPAKRGGARARQSE